MVAGGTLQHPAGIVNLAQDEIAGVVQLPFGGAQIFRPLLLQVDQCPLTAAEGKVLDAGHQQVVVRRVHQLNLSQVTPSGRVSATVTV